MAGMSTCGVQSKLHPSRVSYLPEGNLSGRSHCRHACTNQELSLGKRQRLSIVTSQASRRHHRRRDEDLQGLKLFSKRQDRRKEERTAIGPNVSEDKIVVTIDVEEIKERFRSVGHRTKRIVQESARRAVNAGHGIAQDTMQLVRDLRSSVAVQNNARVVVAVRKSSLMFGARALIWSLVVIVLGRLFLNATRRYRWGWDGKGWSKSIKNVVRDRSLGGKEVTFRSLSPLAGVNLSRSEKDLIKPRRTQVHVKQQDVHLPGWWPRSQAPPLGTSVARRDQAQARARGLVQEMIQKRIGGQDFMEHDILELRRLCRDSGAKVSFDTANSRDSFYRTAIDYVLSATSRAGNGVSSLELANEDATKFIAGLAGHIGLDARRAATMVDAAVAARTRAGFLQAWALFKQKSASECEEELLKLIRIHSCFRPDTNSPEMELVASGLTSYLPEEQRKKLHEIYVACGGSDTSWVAEEALGLVSARRK